MVRASRSRVRPHTLFLEGFMKRYPNGFFAGRKLVWTKYIRIFCDNGHPKFFFLPRFRRMNYDTLWRLFGFSCCIFGREFIFSFGADVHGLYRSIKRGE